MRPLVAAVNERAPAAHYSPPVAVVAASFASSAAARCFDTRLTTRGCSSWEGLADSTLLKLQFPGGSLPSPEIPAPGNERVQPGVLFGFPTGSNPVLP